MLLVVLTFATALAGSVTATEVGDPFPDLALMDAGTVRDIQGQRYVTFWTHWCSPCIAELGDIADAQKRGELPDEITWVAINLDEDRSKVAGALAETGWTETVYYPKNTAIRDDILEDGIPTSFLLDERGVVVWTHRGWGSTTIAEHLADAAESEARLLAREERRARREAKRASRQAR